MGRDKTYEKIASDLYRPALNHDVREHNIQCITFAKGQKINLIPVEPKAWKQVIA